MLECCLQWELLKSVVNMIKTFHKETVMAFIILYKDYKVCLWLSITDIVIQWFLSTTERNGQKNVNEYYQWL